jgi:hypothetical protein
LLIPHPPWYTSPTNLPHHGSAPLKSDSLLDLATSRRPAVAIGRQFR